MRYGNPSIPSALANLREQGCDRILALPLYPQYAASSTASALDAVFQTLRQSRNMPEMRTVRHYHDHPGYIAALANSVRDHWMQNGRPDMLVMSFHGVPKRSLLDKAILTTANARKPAACWPKRWDWHRINTSLLSSRALAAPNGFSPTPHRR